jgi:glycosyltransferase 2 family protein
VLAARRLDMSAFASVASVVVERALDVAALLTIFLVASGLEAGFAPPRMRLAAELLLAGAVVALAVLAFAEAEVAQGGLIERALRRWPKVHSLVEQLSLGAAVLRDPAAALQAVAWSLVLWSVDAGMYWSGARALGLGSVMNYPRSVLTLSWGGTRGALPAAPGGIGTFEAVVKSIVVQFGATPDQALAYALVCHMLNYLLVTVASLILLYRIGLSLADLQGEVEKG